jgi:uncharacterized damage-inducible protein DinB
MSGVRELLLLLDEAFAGAGIEASGESQALLTNLATVGEADWRAVAPGAVRTVEAMVLHVGTCKVMYDDYAFASRSLQWGGPPVQPWPEGEAPMAEALEWLRGTHQRFVEHVAALGDEDLDASRMTNWGEQRATRWIIAAIIGHDFYHAGEINHLRSLLSGEDRWLWVQQLESGES